MLSVKNRRNGRLSMRRFIAKMRRAGWCSHLVWIQRELSNALHARAKELGTTTRLVILAALHVGLQRLRPSDVIAMENRWRGLVSRPAHELIKRGLLKSKQDPKTGRWIGLEPVHRSA